MSLVKLYKPAKLFLSALGETAHIYSAHIGTFIAGQTAHVDLALNYEKDDSTDDGAVSIVVNALPVVDDDIRYGADVCAENRVIFCDTVQTSKAFIGTNKSYLVSDLEIATPRTVRLGLRTLTSDVPRTAMFKLVLTPAPDPFVHGNYGVLGENSFGGALSDLAKTKTFNKHVFIQYNITLANRTNSDSSVVYTAKQRHGSWWYRDKDLRS